MRLIRVSVLTAFVITCTSLAFAGMTTAKTTNPKLKVGEKAPNFMLPEPGRPAGSHTMIKLSDLRGKKNVLLAFYPKAYSSVCTKEMCGFRDDFSKFRSADTDIVAVSVDKQVDSNGFKKLHHMPFSVLGDPHHKVIAAYGIPLRNFNGHHYAQRSVVLIDKHGIIRYINMDYRVGQSEKPLFAAIAALKKQEQGHPQRG